MMSHNDQKMVLVKNLLCGSGEGGDTLVKTMNGCFNIVSLERHFFRALF